MHGIDGITWKVSGYSPAFKLEVVRTIQKEHLSFREAAVRFNISDNKVVKRWMDLFESVGATGLQTRRYIKVKSEKIPEPTTRPPDSVSRPAEDLSHDELLAELRYLRAEVDYLKKLKALAQQKKKLK